MRRNQTPWRPIGRTRAVSAGIAVGFLQLLCVGAVHAQEAEPPVETSLLTVVVFGVLFLLFCIGVVWFIYSNEKRSRAEKGQSERREDPGVPGGTRNKGQ